jgi:hypothetical protein
MEFLILEPHKRKNRKAFCPAVTKSPHVVFNGGWHCLSLWRATLDNIRTFLVRLYDTNMFYHDVM